jgi:ubiquinone/menaquinone biosynthesis C-methylase UbiE
VLDLGAGTGRFLSQLASALPGARLYALDLSAYYLAEAEALLAGVPFASFLVENAERTSLRDGSMDASASVFLFHELPPAARRQVAAEALRVLRPGGRFVVLDSAQRSDSPELAAYLDRFPAEYHEPFYQGYLDDDLAPLFAGAGFEIEEVRPFFLSKRVVARKPR